MTLRSDAPGGPPLVPYTFLALSPQENTLSRSAAVVLPVPYDATATFRAGAREGPDAIIAASRELEDYDPELEYEPSSAGIYTSPALAPHLGSPEGMVERVAGAVGRLARRGKVVATLGGDHSVTIGAVRALAAQYKDLSVLYLDAHADFRDQYLGTKWGHASVARRVSEMCAVTLVGVRSMSQEEAEALRAANVPLFPAGGKGQTVSWGPVLATLSDRVYVSVDLDVFDPSFMAAVGTPEPGGLGWHEALGLLRRVADAKRIVGFDVVELAPREGPAACAYIAAKLAYKLIGYSTLRRRRRTSSGAG